MNLLCYLSKNFWLLMKKHKVVYSKVAINDIDTVVDYIASIYRKESGLRYISPQSHPEYPELLLWEGLIQ